MSKNSPKRGRLPSIKELFGDLNDNPPRPLSPIKSEPYTEIPPTTIQRKSDPIFYTKSSRLLGEDERHNEQPRRSFGNVLDHDAHESLKIPVDMQDFDAAVSRLSQIAGQSNTYATVHECPICGAQFAKKFNLDGHLKSHLDKKYACSICEKPFQRRNDVQRHIRSVHSNEKPFRCQLCEVGFSRSDGLKTHLESVSHRNKVKLAAQANLQ